MALMVKKIVALPQSLPIIASFEQALLSLLRVS